MATEQGTSIKLKGRREESLCWKSPNQQVEPHFWVKQQLEHHLYN